MRKQAINNGNSRNNKGPISKSSKNNSVFKTQNNQN